MASLFIDWCPRPTYAFSSMSLPSVVIDKSELIKETLTFGLSSDLIKDNVDSVSFSYRTDGFFIFEVVWVNRPGSRKEHNAAGIIAHVIKGMIGHVHQSNDSPDCVVRMGSWRPLHKYPVKISIDSTLDVEGVSDKLQHFISDNSRISRLMSHSRSLAGAENPIDFSVPGILRVREKYSRLFDRTFDWYLCTKKSTIFGLQYYGCFYLYIFSYFLMLFFYTALDVEVQRSDGASFSDPILSSAILVGAFAFVVYLLWKSIASALLYVKPYFDGFLALVSNENVSKEIYEFYRRFDIINLPSILFVVLTSGVFAFSFKEAPNFVDVFKLVGSEYADGVISKLVSENAKFSVISAVYTDGFWLRYFLEVMFYFPAFMMAIFILDDSRRKRVIRAFSSLRNHLRYGNILTLVVGRIMEEGAVGRGAFDQAIFLVSCKIEVEKRKRNKNRIFIAIIFILSLSVTLFHSNFNMF